MAYSLKWSPNHPGHLVYLIDLSESMGWEKNKRINMLLEVLNDVCEFLIANDSPRGPIDNSATVSMIGYNTDITTLFSGDFIALDNYLETLNGKPLFDIDGKAKPQWQTFMADAFEAAERDIRQWIDKQVQAGKPTPAPIVINITDGVPEEGKDDPGHVKAMARAKAAAQKLMEVSVPDGKVLLFNIHIMEGGTPLVLPSSRPSSDSEHPERQFLFDVSSPLNEAHIKTAQGLNIKEAQPGSRFMASGQTDKNKLMRLIQFGSTVSQIKTKAEQVKPQ